jgi:hypothetical protein
MDRVNHRVRLEPALCGKLADWKSIIYSAFGAKIYEFAFRREEACDFGCEQVRNSPMLFPRKVRMRREAALISL